MVHGGIILTTLWSGYSDAMERREYRWIINVAKKMYLLLLVIFIGLLAMIFISPFLIKIWVGEINGINFLLITVMALYTFLIALNGTAVSMLNGIGAVNLQLIVSVVCAIITIPMSVYMAVGFKLGISGVILGGVISYLPLAVIMTLQTYLILLRFEKLSLQYEPQV